MFNFIQTIREDRRNEIQNHKLNGIEFIRENDYKLVQKIIIPRDDIYFTFEVRVDFNEVRFYIIKYGSCLYLSIYDIYMLLNDIYINSDIDIIEELSKVYDNATDKFIYNSCEYKFPKSSKIESQYQINIPYSNLTISYNELLVLIFLIQEKSNYLCSISDEMNIYKNGLVNLLITLLKCRKDNTFLKELGWHYSPDKNKYSENKLVYLNKEDENYEIRKRLVDRKYYLTKTEMEIILKT